jgi:hypothetical protein
MAESLKAECGLTPEADWDIDIDLRKTPFGRRVVVRLTHRPTGRTAEDTVVGGLYKRSVSLGGVPGAAAGPTHGDHSEGKDHRPAGDWQAEAAKVITGRVIALH